MKRFIFSVLCACGMSIAIGAVVEKAEEYFSANQGAISRKLGVDLFRNKVESEQPPTVQLIEVSSSPDTTGSADQDGQLKIFLARPADSCDRAPAGVENTRKTIIIKRSAAGSLPQEFKIEHDKDM